MEESRAGSSSSSSPSGYALGPPWLFRGRALYQLHLVKAEIARAFIPKELKLVEAFGYTLGGLFLAHYDESPAGVFDELVVLAGIVWNPPTSCAWASRVLVNSHEACRHGRKEIGLPSHVAIFSKVHHCHLLTSKVFLFGSFRIKALRLPDSVVNPTIYGILEARESWENRN